MAAEIQVDVAIREPWSSSGTCDDDAPRASCLLQVGGKAMHELDYSSRNLMCTASSALLHPARVPDSIRTATLRAAYDSPGVTLFAFCRIRREEGVSQITSSSLARITKICHVIATVCSVGFHHSDQDHANHAYLLTPTCKLITLPTFTDKASFSRGRLRNIRRARHLDNHSSPHLDSNRLISILYEPAARMG